jgi:hypothetical protein
VITALFKSVFLLLLASTPLTASATPIFDSQLSCLISAVRNLGYKVDPRGTTPRPYDEGPSQFLLSAQDMPWTSNFFPMEKNGIAIRWQVPDSPLPDDFSDPGKLLTSTDHDTAVRRVKSLSSDQLNKLSAVEKFDILKGNYEFPATRTEMRMRGPQRDIPPEFWEGFCNGVCAASIAQAEPKHPVTLTNPDGIQVTFEPNDIKALASASYFYVEKYAAVGSPNRTKLSIDLESLPDPGALDWALTHYLGQLHKPFVADTNPNNQIWNHVVIGYTRNLEELKPADGTAPAGVKWTTVANVNITYNTFVDHLTANTDTAKATAEGANQKTRYYRYQLYLDENKNIVGGKWPDNGSEKTVDAPNFLWFPAGKGTDSTEGYNPYIDFNQVKELVNKSHDF